MNVGQTKPNLLAGLKKNGAHLCAVSVVITRLFYYSNILSLRTFLAFDYVEFHPLTFFKAAVSSALDCGVMYEYIFRAIPFDETETFCGVEPFHNAFNTFGHDLDLLSKNNCERSNSNPKNFVLLRTIADLNITIYFIFEFVNKSKWYS